MANLSEPRAPAARVKAICIWLVAVVAAGLTVVAGCSNQSARPVFPHQHLKVALRVNPASYYWLDRRPTGLDHSLLQLFAEKRGVRLEIVPTVTAAEAVRLLEQNRVQIAAGALSADASLQERFLLSPPYEHIRQRLIYRHPDTGPTGLNRVAMKDIDISPHPAHLETLRRARKKNHDFTKWYLHENTDSHTLIEWVNLGLIRYTLADSNELAATQLFHPYVKAAFDVSGDLPVVWLFRKDAPETLTGAVAGFFSEITASRELDRLIDVHHPHVQELSYAEKLTFRELADRQLPKYSDEFRRVAKLHGLDWKLLAAISYQESHWNPRAVSPTGVRGLMMLTRDTARQHGINDRADPRDSIRGGALHFVAVRNKIADTIPEPDRTWMALAAYNSGYGHLKDAIALTQRRGGNPGLWVDIAKALELLQKPEWFRQAQHGKPRGGDTSLYVRNVRNYQRLIDMIEGDITTDTPQPSRLNDLAPATP